jgi:hypothetical protein
VEARLLYLTDTDEAFADNISVFIKPEPHKQMKLDEGRLRLISAVSFVDTMVDRVLFGWLAKRVLTTVGSTPVMVGWVPLFGQWRAFRERFSDKILCVDKSSWDWTVQAWMIDAFRLLIRRLAIGADPWWVRAFEKRFDLLFRDARFQFRDGTVVQQGEAGVMKSGCFLTIILNSLGQLLLHSVAILEMGVPDPGMPFAMGDDTVQELGDIDVEWYTQTLRLLGANPKFEVLRDVEFAGFFMSRDTCVPVYRAKHLFRLEYAAYLGEFCRSMQMLYANDEQAYNLFAKVALNLAPDYYLPRPVAMKLLNGAPGEIRMGLRRR